MAEHIKANIERVLARIAVAAERAGRSKEGVKLVAVSKTHPAETICSAVNAGVTAFGENRVQEAVGKIPNIKAEWHLIGHLQANKARRAVELFDVIQTLDSPELAARLDRICGELGRPTLPVLIQVDLAGEANKSGVPESRLAELAAAAAECRRLELRGLMTVPPFFEDTEKVRPYFRRLRELRDELAAAGVFADGSGELSMGMSHDLDAAVEEGATLVRVGTAIFGER